MLLWLEREQRTFAFMPRQVRDAFPVSSSVRLRSALLPSPLAVRVVAPRSDDLVFFVVRVRQG